MEETVQRSMSGPNSFEEVLERDGVLIYRNKGVSMMPLIRQGRDLMEIRPRPKERLRKYDAVLYRSGERYIMHRILRVLPEGYVIAGDHCTWSEVVQEERIIGILTAVIRDKHRIAVTDRTYRIYVHLWCDFYHVRVLLIHLHNLLGRVKRRLLKMGK